jgi:ABC-type polysaccharide/polyol phosphate transport system ATPase subunit
VGEKSHEQKCYSQAKTLFGKAVSTAEAIMALQQLLDECTFLEEGTSRFSEEADNLVRKLEQLQ